MKYRHKHQIVQAHGVSIENVLAKVHAGNFERPSASLFSLIQEIAGVLTPAQQRALADRLGYEEVTE